LFTVTKLSFSEKCKTNTTITIEIVWRSHKYIIQVEFFNTYHYMLYIIKKIIIIKITIVLYDVHEIEIKMCLQYNICWFINKHIPYSILFCYYTMYSQVFSFLTLKTTTTIEIIKNKISLVETMFIFFFVTVELFLCFIQMTMLDIKNVLNISHKVILSKQWTFGEYCLICLYVCM